MGLISMQFFDIIFPSKLLYFNYILQAFQPKSNVKNERNFVFDQLDTIWTKRIGTDLEKAGRK
ncbi:hypothetical protein DMR_09340 [Solidesulfovibrio magneticus RS-1]|uniref:Uncharacterized protein n=1 Tax=Solidesulfovibrio magneticus (strain ATCC 700980 / DSM 13731 / RS-1) TaxID=573370 RepID=C4XKN3_SOLM1|nr:hypothetical protein DMR_09340 [Solidesulfovibrio magneticus RS-1]